MIAPPPTRHLVVKSNDISIGDGLPCFIVAEIGINHNGSLANALSLIDVAKRAGCDAVKFQKRSVEVVYTQEELQRPRDSPFGKTNGDLKRGLEFDSEGYEQIFAHCQKVGLACFASVWDPESVGFMEQFAPAFNKVPSPMLTNDSLLRSCASIGRPVILSTGMSDYTEVSHANDVLGDSKTILLHCTSAYPCRLEDANLTAIRTLRHEFHRPVGYSGHEVGILPSIAAVVLGSVLVERHITLSRYQWGSDQAISLEPDEIAELVAGIRSVELAMGEGTIQLLDSELPAMNKLRRASLNRLETIR